MASKKVLERFIWSVANTLYDGCELGHHIAEVSNDTEHDTLVDLVQRARELVNQEEPRCQPIW